MTTFRDKKVLFVSQYENSGFWDVEWQFESVIIDPIYNDKINNVNLNTNCITNIPENSVFYFGKTSKFPRFKLKAHNYKRCNTYEKSNIQVIKNIEYRKIKDVCIFEKDDVYYIVPELENRAFYKKNYITGVSYWTWKTLSFPSTDEKIKYIKKMYGFEDPIYIGTIFTTSCNEWEDLLKIIENKFTCVITDDNLDKVINKKMDNVTEADVDLLQDLLWSRDLASLELGLKMLMGYNCSKYSSTIKLLLRNPRLKETKAWISTGLKQVKSTVGFRCLGWALQSVEWHVFNQETYDPDDLRLAHYLWKKIIMPTIDRQMSCYNIPGLSFKCYAE